MGELITVALPTWNTPPEMLAAAVESILAQTERRFVVAVVNDGGHELELNVSDSRVRVVTLPENRGVYYCESLVLAACQTEWWTVHAADDWSEPDRFETLLEAAGDAEAVTSSTIYHHADGTDTLDLVKARPVGHGQLRTISRHPAHLYRAEALRGVGISSDLRGSVDTAVVSLFWHRHQVNVVDRPLYHVRKWPGSLTAHPATALNTKWRQLQRHERQRRFNDALRRGGQLQGFAPDPDHVEALSATLAVTTSEGALGR